MERNVMHRIQLKISYLQKHCCKVAAFVIESGCLSILIDLVTVNIDRDANGQR